MTVPETRPPAVAREDGRIVQCGPTSFPPSSRPARPSSRPIPLAPAPIGDASEPAGTTAPRRGHPRYAHGRARATCSDASFPAGGLRQREERRAEPRWRSPMPEQNPARVVQSIANASENRSTTGHHELATPTPEALDPVDSPRLGSSNKMGEPKGGGLGRQAGQGHQAIRPA